MVRVKSKPLKRVPTIYLPTPRQRKKRKKTTVTKFGAVSSLAQDPNLPSTSTAAIPRLIKTPYVRNTRKLNSRSSAKPGTGKKSNLPSKDPSGNPPTSIRKRGKKDITKSSVKCPVQGCDFEATHHEHREAHLEIQHECAKCGETELDLNLHKCSAPKKTYSAKFDIDESVFKESTDCHRGSLLIYVYTPKKLVCMVAELVNSVRDGIIKLFRQIVHFFHGIRFRIELQLDLIEIDSTQEKKDVFVPTAWYICSHEQFIRSKIFLAVSELLQILNLYNERKSNWQVLRINYLKVHFTEYVPQAGRGHIPLPLELKRRQGIINIKNRGNNCFQLCVLAALYSEDIIDNFLSRRAGAELVPNTAAYAHAIKAMLERPTQYEKMLKYIKCVNFSGLSTEENRGVSLASIDNFEDANPAISVSVYANYGEKLIPVRNTKKIKGEHINLALISSEGKSHYVWLRDMARTLGVSGKHAHLFCPYCSRPFRQPNALHEHILSCGLGSDPVTTSVPPNEQFYKFNKYQMTLKNPHCLYYLFHSLEENSNPSNKTKIPTSYSLLLSTSNGFHKPEFYQGEDCVVHFLERVMEIAKSVISEISDTNIEPTLTPSQEVSFQNAEQCDMCLEPFSVVDYKVKHHVHWTGAVGSIGSIEPAVMCRLGRGQDKTGAVHNSCNLQVKIPKYLNCISTKSQSFFEKIIELGFESNVIFKDPEPIMINKKLMGMKVNNILRFNVIENYMNTELSMRVRQTHEANGLFSGLNIFMFRHRELIPNILDNFPICPTAFTMEQLDSAFDPAENCLPMSVFENSAEPCSELQYNVYKQMQHALNFSCSSDFVEFYLKMKCHVLAGILDHYRDAKYSIYGIDPIYSWTTAAFAKECSVFVNRSKVEYLTCPIQNYMTEKLIKGGLNILNERHTRANHTGMPNYDPETGFTEILEFDRILSYGSECLKPLPVSSYEFLTLKELMEFNFKSPPTDDTVGYVFECSLKLPNKFHRLYASFPLWPERRKIELEDMTPTQLNDQANYWGKKITLEDRLLLTLFPKTDDCFSHLSISFMLSHNYELVSVKRGFRYKAEPFLRDYVQFNVDLRNNSKCKLEMDDCKDMINAVYGKYLSKNLAQPTYAYCHSRTRARILCTRDKFSNVTILSNNLSLFEFKKGKGKDFNLRLVSAIILENSKIAMYDFFYNQLRPVFGLDMRLCFSNTDSLLVAIFNKNYESGYVDKLKLLSEWFDFSKFPKGHPLHDPTERNKGKPGCFRIVHDNIVEFVGKRSTNYSLSFLNGNTLEYKCTGARKGVDTGAARHELLLSEIKSFRDVRKKLYSVKLNKEGSVEIKINGISLSTCDLSRIWYNPISSVPFGYKGDDYFDLPRYAM